MANTEFEADNIKCMGCVNTIRTGLAELDGVDEVAVDLETAHVTVTGHDLSMAVLADKMKALGYPIR